MRHLGLSANQVVHVPGAGDFQIERIEGADEPVALGAAPRPTSAATNGESCADLADTSCQTNNGSFPGCCLGSGSVREDGMSPPQFHRHVSMLDGVSKHSLAA